MSNYSVFFVLAVFLCFIGGVSGAASGVPILLEIIDAKCNDGIISANVMVENNSPNPIAEKYLGTYLLARDSAGTVYPVFIGWVVLPYLRTGESTMVPFTGVVPSGVVGGTYQLATIITTSYGLSSPDFAEATMQEITIQGGTGSATEVTALPVSTTLEVEQNMPNYQITALSVPSSTSLYPGAKITPSVSVVNTGGNAVEEAPISIALFLGNQALYPEKATIPSIAPGKSANVQLSYKIPDNIYLGAYIMRGLVNPYGVIAEETEENNVFTVPGSYFISDNWVEARAEAGGCGCGS